jgi:hypothetical protein
MGIALQEDLARILGRIWYTQGNFAENLQADKKTGRAAGMRGLLRRV